MKTIRLLISLCLVLSYALSANYWSHYCYDEAYDINQSKSGKIFLGATVRFYPQPGTHADMRGTYILPSTYNPILGYDKVMGNSCTTSDGQLFFSIEYSSEFYKVINDNAVLLLNCPANITSLIALQDSVILAGTPNGVFKYSHDNTWSLFSNGIEVTNPIDDLLKDHDGKLYAITNNKIYYLQNETWIEQTSLPVSNPVVKSIAFGKNNDQWLLTENGIYQKKTGYSNWVLKNEGINQVDKIWKLKSVNGDVIIAYGYYFGTKLYKIDKFNYWQDISSGLSGGVNSIFLAADDYFYVGSSSGLYKSSNPFTYNYPTVMSMPSQLKIKTFGSTKINLTDYITNEEHSGFITGNLSWSCVGNSNFNIQRNGNEINISKLNQNWFGSQQFNFVFSDTITMQVLQNTVSLVAEQPLMLIPDTLFVQNDCKTDYDFTPYIKDVDSSITYLNWNNSQYFNISKSGQTVIFQPKTLNWLGKEKIIFKLSNSKNYSEDTVIVKSTKKYSIHTIKPLFIGNKYFFEDEDNTALRYKSEVIKDTIIDGFRHYVFSGASVNYGSGVMTNARWVERSNNMQVLSGDKPLNYLWKTGDHCQYGNIQSVYSINLWNKPYTQYETYYFASNDKSTQTKRLEFIDFFGMIHYAFLFGYKHGRPGNYYTYNFIGAVINGVHYGITTDIDNETAINSFELKQNYPNPFNPSTTIQFSLAKPAMTELKVYNSRGEVVKTLIKGLCNAGNQQVQFDGSSFASGVYYYRLTTPEQSLSGKMMLIK